MIKAENAMQNTSDFDLLLHRLKRCSEIKYPDRPWSKNFYDIAAERWKDKIEQLKERVISLEQELNL